MIVNKKITLTLLFILAVGVCTGAFFEVYMQGEGKEQLMEMLSGFFSGGSTQSFHIAFFNCIKIWLIIALILFLCPVFPPLAVMCPVIPLLKGLALGFSATMLVETFKVKGVWYIVSTMLPHGLIQIPALCVLAALSLQGAFLTSKYFLSKRRRSANKNALQNYARQYLICYGITMVFIIISCLIEAALM